MKIDLILKDMKDQLVRENFFRVQSYLMSQTMLAPDFSFFEIDIPVAATLYPIAHGLSFAPTDLLQLSAIGDLNFHFRFDKFDSTSIYVTTSGPVRIRFLLGRFAQKGKRSLKESDLPFVAPA